MEHLFAIGFISILGQVVLLRELSVAFYGVELIYTLAIGAWLLWTGCGAMISRRTLQPRLSQINLLFVLLSVILPADVAFIRSIRLIFEGVPGAYLPLHTQIAAMSVSLLPLGLILGLLFQWAAKVFVTGERSLAAAYAIESLGGLAGGLCATLFLKFGFQNLWIALLCSLLAAGSSFLNVENKSVKWLRPATTIIIMLLLLLIWKAPAVDRFMTAWTHPYLVETKDSPYSRVTITQMKGQVSVFENDALLFETEGTEAEEFVHLAALQHPYPDRVLVLGGGIAGTVREVLQYSPRIVDYVELNPVLLDRVPPYLSPEVQKSLRAGNVRIISADPRRFLSTAPSYDLILIGMPEPTSGQSNRFYTQEFFRQCSAKLNDHGVIAFSLRSSENLWTAQLTRRMVSIYRAVKSAFPEILVIPGGTNVVIGSRDFLTRDPSVLAARLESRKVKTRLVSPAYLRYLFTNDRFFQIARTLESGTAPINTDVRPICYQYTIMIWLSKFIPSAKFLDFTLPDSRGGRIALLLWMIAVGLPVLFLLSRARWSFRRALLMGVAGAIGMILETLLILHYQTKNGILYQDVGILLMSFMAGLALGAPAVARGRRRASTACGIVVLSGFAALGAFVGLEISSGRGASLAEALALLVLSGFFVGGIFAYASLREDSDQRKVIAPLYSADLVGGCIGSLAASLFLAPLAGLCATAYMTAPIVILSVLLL